MNKHDTNTQDNVQTTMYTRPYFKTLCRRITVNR